VRFCLAGALQGCTTTQKVKPLIRSLIAQKCALIARIQFICFRVPAEIIKVHKPAAPMAALTGPNPTPDFHIHPATTRHP
jgi:hypothetical protein